MGLRRNVEPLDRRLSLSIEAATPSSYLDTDINLETQSAATAAASTGDSVVVYSDRDHATGKGNEVWIRSYNVDGTPGGASTQVNTTSAGAQMNVDVAMLSTSIYAVTWQSENQDGSGWGVYARLHTASGWTNEILVPQTTTNAQVNPSIAMTSNGGFVVAWVGRDDNGGTGEIYARRFDATGVAATNEIAISTNGSTVGSTSPDIATSPNGIAIAWVSSDITTDAQTDVLLRRYDLGLTTATSAPVIVNTTTAGDQAEPQIANLTGTNDFVVAFSDTSGGDAVVSFRRMGTATFAQQQASQDTDGSRSRPRISSANGTTVIGWSLQPPSTFFNSTYTRVYDANLNPISNETPATDGSSERTLYGLAVTGRGTFREVATLGEFSGYGIASTTTYANVLQINGTSGNDKIVAYDQNATTLRISVNGVAQSVSTTGYDHLRIELGDGNDSLTATAVNNLWITVGGGNGNDTILTGGGNDSINAGDGNDSIDAGAGNDYVTGGDDNDILLGGLGNDSLAGAAGKDLIYGGDGNDRLTGGNGVDVIYGEGGDDRVYGEAGDDRLDAGAGRDRVYGGDGNDSMLGGSNNDHMYGEAGNDTMTGSKGNDILEGGPGNDLAYNVEPGDTLIDIERH